MWFSEDDPTFEDERFAELDAEECLPADGLLTGAAEFEGHSLHFVTNGFSVKAGSMAERSVEKFLRIQHRALQTGRPVLYLMNSSGGRIDQQTGFFSNREGIGKYCYNHSMLSGAGPTDLRALRPPYRRGGPHTGVCGFQSTGRVAKSSRVQW